LILALKYRTHAFLLALMLAGMLLLVMDPLKDTGTLCLFRNVTGVACPSCGTGHGVQHLLQGDFVAAWQANPFSYLALPGMMILSVLIIADLSLRKNYLQQFFNFLKSHLRLSSAVTWMLIALVILNWYFTILKY
jgi:hypothetical protein